ncbi:MAG TPA: DUF929 family protein [Ktedonobacterales bacterium]
MAKPKRPQQNTHQTGRQTASRSATAGADRTGASRSATTGSAQPRPPRTPQTVESGKTQVARGVTRTVTQGSRAVTSGTANGAAKGASEATRRYQPLATRTPSARGAAKRKSARQAWWQKNLPLLIAGVTVVLLVGIIVLIAHNASGGPAGIGDPAPANVTQPLTQAPASLYASVGTGGLSSPFKHIGGNGGGGDIAKGSGGKPVFFYAGAEYCPFCAAERWSMVMAVSRFGTISNLHLSASSGTDNYPNTPTFTFIGSSYSSNTIDFQSLEAQGRDQNNSTPLQTPTAQQGQFLKFNGKPYLSDNGIPYLDVANQYVTNGSGYQPGALDNMTWQQISDTIKSSPHDTVTQDIVGNANYITAAICQTTGQQPASVCQQAPIPDIEKKL